MLLHINGSFNRASQGEVPFLDINIASQQLMNSAGSLSTPYKLKLHAGPRGEGEVSVLPPLLLWHINIKPTIKKGV